MAAAAERPQFSSLQEEMEYYKARFEETQTEFEEYQQGSRELEMEMEAQLLQLEKENAELKRNLSKLQRERDTLAEKFTCGTSELKNQLEVLEKKYLEERDANERFSLQIRELEQDNDNLERAKRVLNTSLEHFELRINQAIERNAFLESELDEKKELQVLVQRLKDEVNDLKNDAMVRSRLERNGSVNGNGLPSGAAPLTTSPANLISSNGSLAQHHRKRSPALVAGCSPRGSVVAEDTLGRSSPLKMDLLPPHHPTIGAATIQQQQQCLQQQQQQQFLPQQLQQQRPSVSLNTLHSVDLRTQQQKEASILSPQVPCAGHPELASAVSSGAPSPLPAAVSHSPSQQQLQPLQQQPLRRSINPHSRTNALNIVNDLLKRVGELETKMATAQFCM